VLQCCSVLQCTALYFTVLQCVRDIHLVLTRVTQETHLGPNIWPIHYRAVPRHQNGTVTVPDDTISGYVSRYSIICNSDWLGNPRSPPFGGSPRKNVNGAAAGGNTRISKSGVDTDETIHTIMFSSHGLTQVLQLFTSSSYSRCPHHQNSHTATISRFLILSIKSVVFGSFLLSFSN